MHYVGNDVFEHCLHDGHVALKVAERHFRLDHPEFRSVVGRVGIFGAERRPEGVYLAEGEREGLDMQLARDSQAGVLAEEVLGVVAVLAGGDGEAFAGALGVVAGDYRGVDIGKAVFAEKFVKRLRHHRADLKYRHKDLLDDAIEMCIETGQASTSFIQRRFKVGYARAGRIIDQMEERGIISGYQGSKPREVLMTRERWQELKMGQGNMINQEENMTEQQNVENNVEGE